MHKPVTTQLEIKKLIKKGTNNLKPRKTIQKLKIFHKNFHKNICKRVYDSPAHLNLTMSSLEVDEPQPRTEYKIKKMKQAHCPCLYSLGMM